MNPINRRNFLGVAAAGASVFSLRCAREPALDRTLLVAVGGAVLPGELGADGPRRIADEFLSWVNEYVPGAERNHGYGTDELTVTETLPLAQWAEQLRQLEDAARERFGASFGETATEDGRDLIRDVLRDFPDDRLGDPANAQHVAVALLAYFYDTAEATDLAYLASIKKQQCRPLHDAPNRPIALG